MDPMKPTVLVGKVDDQFGFPPYFIEEIEKHFRVISVTDVALCEVADDIVGIISYFFVPQITLDLLQTLHNLKIVAVLGVGYDHIDIEMVNSFGVKVSNTPYVHEDTVADLAMTLLMAAGRDLCQAVSIAKSPTTTAFALNTVSMDISYANLGIVGMGRIGCKIAERANAFNMNIFYHNRHKRSDNDAVVVNATYYERLNDMLPLCDYVMISAKLTPETQNMMGAEQFKLMKNTSVLVNISRGGTVDHDALASALSSGQIHFAALDVTEPEPLPRDHPLLKMSNVIITPHVGNATLKTRVRVVQKAIDNVLAAIAGRQLPSEIKK